MSEQATSTRGQMLDRFWRLKWRADLDESSTSRLTDLVIWRRDLNDLIEQVRPEHWPPGEKPQAGHSESASFYGIALHPVTDEYDAVHVMEDLEAARKRWAVLAHEGDDLETLAKWVRVKVDVGRPQELLTPTPLDDARRFVTQTELVVIDKMRETQRHAVITGDFTS